MTCRTGEKAIARIRQWKFTAQLRYSYFVTDCYQNCLYRIPLCTCFWALRRRNAVSIGVKVGVKMGVFRVSVKPNLHKKLEKHPVLAKNRVFYVVAEAGFEPTTFGL